MTLPPVRDSPWSASGDPNQGRVLAGRYTLIATLGRGGMGSVWRARDANLDSEVAIKLIAPEFAQSAEAVARFRREARAGAAIRSTHVVQILDHGVDGNTPFIAMELLKGESLAERLARVRRLPPRETVRILGHVARALSLAHEHGIVHRDMKPDNIFLDREGDEDVGKVLDFGIARHSSGLEGDGGIKTQTDALLGTPYYMSPEQANGDPVDGLSDIWSFGVIAYECLIGQRPFTAPTAARLFHAICLAKAPRPSDAGAVPVGFDAWFARAAARDKQDRFSTIRDAIEELKQVCENDAQESLPPEAAESALGSTVTEWGSGKLGLNAQRSSGSPRPLEVSTPPTAKSLMFEPRKLGSVFAAAAIAFTVLAAGSLTWRLWPRTSSAQSANSGSGSAESMVAATSTTANGVPSARVLPAAAATSAFETTAAGAAERPPIVASASASSVQPLPSAEINPPSAPRKPQSLPPARRSSNPAAASAIQSPIPPQSQKLRPATNASGI